MYVADKINALGVLGAQGVGSSPALPLRLLKAWPEYETYVYEVPNTKFRLIYRNGEPVAVVRSHYQVVPLEESIDVASKALSALGLSRMTAVQTKTTVYVFHMDTGRAFEFSDGSRVHVGVYAQNSIDGSSKLRFDLFTFRDVCRNLAMLALKQIEWGESLGRVKAMVKAVRETADFGVVGHIAETHTRKGVKNWERFRDSLGSLLAFGEKVIEIYKRWEDMELERETAEELSKRLPEKTLRASGFRMQGDKLVGWPANMWEAYNGLTASIWHGSASIARKQQLYRQLHEVLIPPRVV